MDEKTETNGLEAMCETSVTVEEAFAGSVSDLWSSPKVE
jgi:hypothetical protein